MQSHSYIVLHLSCRLCPPSDSNHVNMNISVHVCFGMHIKLFSMLTLSLVVEDQVQLDLPLPLLVEELQTVPPHANLNCYVVHQKTNILYVSFMFNSNAIKMDTSFIRSMS